MATTGLKPTDAQIERAVKGDGTAFTALWDMYIGGLGTYLRSSFKYLDDFHVEDICSRSFEKAFRQIGTFDPSIGSFFTWLKRIARNTALDVLEQESRMQPLSLEDGLESDVSGSMTDEEDSALDTIIRIEDMEETLRCIEGLPELYRDIAGKRLVDGLSYKEIAQECNLELNTVRTRIRRAKMMIDKLSKESDLK